MPPASQTTRSPVQFLVTSFLTLLKNQRGGGSQRDKLKPEQRFEGAGCVLGEGYKDGRQHESTASM